MKNENDSAPERAPLEQAQHERLCAYVFDETQGAERAAFEAELAASETLRAEHARLVATVGLVKTALPDERLSAAVRRDLLASARRSRFRFLSGRRIATLVAVAALVVVGLAVALRRLPAPQSSFTYGLGGEATAKLERQQAPPATAAEESALKGLGYRGEEASAHELAFEPAPAPAAPRPSTSQERLLAESTGLAPASEVATSSALGGSQDALSLKVDRRAFAKMPARSTTPGAVENARAGTPDFFNLDLAGFVGADTGNAPSGRGTGRLTKDSTAVDAPAPAATGLGAAAVPLARAKEKKAEAPAPEMLQSLRDLGYSGELGYVGDDEDERDAPRDSFAPHREPLPPRERVEAHVEQLLASTRPAPGESPRDMFFRYFGDSPFVPALEEQSSTFAVDVDTASYALTRAYLNRGTLPPREAVRTEEFLNYFKADQAPPTDGKPFALGLELAPSLFASDPRTEMLRVTVRGKDVADFERQPVALTFVIDNSGSMAGGGRLELVKRSLIRLLGQLYAGDSVAVVKFSNTAALLAPMTPVARRGELEAAIQALGTEGGTNVEAGLRLGYEQALQHLARNTVNRVILCSDGVGNIGETGAQGLLALVEDARKQGIYLNTVGVGMGNHDDAFLEQLADRGDGVCNYVDSDAEAKRVFVDRLASALQPIARDVKIQLEFDPAQVESWRLLGYENRALRNQDFKNDRVDAGEVNAGHQVTALYELVRRPGRAGALATLRLRYKPPFAIDQGKEGRAAKAEAETALELERTLEASAVLPGFASASNGYQRAVLVAQFAEVLRRSVHARGDSFARLLQEAQRLDKAMGDPDVSEFVALLEKANPLLDARAREERPEVQDKLDELSRLQYELALRERTRELAHEAGEPEPSAEEQKDAQEADRTTREAIRLLEEDLRALVGRIYGDDNDPKRPLTPADLRLLEEIGYSDR